MNSFALRLAALGLLALAAAGCKDDLNEKADIHLTVASTLGDYQQLLDGASGDYVNNNTGLRYYGSLGEYLSDNLYLTDARYTQFFAASPFITSLYKWDKNLFDSFTLAQGLAEWNTTYANILTANIALEGVNGIAATAANQTAWNNVKGTALFMRGSLFYSLAQYWAAPYQASSAASDLGIVLRLSSDPNVTSTRTTVEASYQQIIADLTAAAALLPDNTSQGTALSKVRPSKAAAYGMLARTYLAMGDYANVVKYADASLQLYSTLLDYPALTATKFYSVPNFHAEQVYYAVDTRGTVGNTFGFWNADSVLYKSFDANDLRKTLLYNQSPFYGLLFVGDYSGADGRTFTGLATDELYLLRAEGNARLGNTAAALTDLNALLVKRWATGTYVPRTASSALDALTQILTERRKELQGRGLRWTDLRRLNLDSRFAKTLTRTLAGQTHTLPPNDSRYTLQIPAYVVAASNGSIVQNP